MKNLVVIIKVEVEKIFSLLMALIFNVIKEFSFLKEDVLSVIVSYLKISGIYYDRNR